MTARADHAAPRQDSDEYLTPFPMIQAVGPFDTDPAHPIPGTAANLTWRTAEHCYSRLDNGLLQRWLGMVLLNPPYRARLIEHFMARMAEHDNGIAIVNARTDTGWFAKYVWPAASALLFLYQRVRFIPANGELGRNHSGHATVLIAYGAKAVDRLEDCGLNGAFQALPGSCHVIAVYRTESTVTWVELLAQVATRQGGKLTTALAYVLVRQHPKALANQNHRAKIRQILQGPMFERIAPATYRLKGAA